MARVTPPPIDPVPTPPIQRGDRATFSNRVDAFIRWLVNAVTQFQSVATNVYNNAVDAFQSAAGAATSATNANTSATNAGNSATAAQSARDAAEDASEMAMAYALALTATSTTSLVIGTGSKTFTGSGLQAKQFNVGQILYAVNPTDSAQWMSGTLTSYNNNGASSSLTLNVTDVNPATSGQTVANWAINISGVKGAAGANGGVTGGNLTGALNERRATSDVPSAATVDIWSGNGNYVGITGTATITGFAPAPQAGATRRLLISGSPTITAGTNLIVKGVASGSSTPTTSGDEIEVVAETTTRFRATVIKADGTSVAGSAMLQAQDIKTSGTSAGTSTGVQEITRTLSTATINTIPGALLSSNMISLPAGTYDIQGFASSNANTSQRVSLWNVTDSSRDIMGISVGEYSYFSGRISIASTKQFELRHYLNNTQNNSGNLGRPVAQPGVPEVFSSVEVMKIK